MSRVALTPERIDFSFTTSNFSTSMLKLKEYCNIFVPTFYVMCDLALKSPLSAVDSSFQQLVNTS